MRAVWEDLPRWEHGSTCRCACPKQASTIHVTGHVTGDVNSHVTDHAMGHMVGHVTVHAMGHVTDHVTGRWAVTSLGVLLDGVQISFSRRINLYPNMTIKAEVMLQV
eukprot:233958-Chlamydomonas_euryale.AAC.1